MTEAFNRQDMSVVLVACSSAYGESQPMTATNQPGEGVSSARTVAFTSLPIAVSSEDPFASPIQDSLPGQRLDTSDSNQGLDHIARDILTRGGYGGVEVGYCRSGCPSVEDAIEHAVAHGAPRIVVVPIIFSLLHSSPCECCAKTPLDSLRHRIAEVQARHPRINIVYASPPFDHDSQVDLILSRIREYEPVTFKAGALHLNDLTAGQIGVVCELAGGPHFRSRMASLGFTPGVLVKMVQNYGHGAVIVSLRGARVALGRGEARKVGVTRRTDREQPGIER